MMYKYINERTIKRKNYKKRTKIIYTNSWGVLRKGGTMRKLKYEEQYILQDLFEHSEDTMIKSYLQGYMGTGYGYYEHGLLKAGIIFTGCFLFIEGVMPVEELEMGIHEVLLDNNENFGIAISENADIHSHLEELNSYRNPNICESVDDDAKVLFNKFNRFRIAKREEPFDENLLCNLIENLPNDYRLVQLNEELYHMCNSLAWSKDFVYNFRTAEEFVTKGIGYLILKGDEIVAGATSYSLYDEGIEVQIETHKNYRKQGLATVVGAKLILECQRKGMYPSWDAANMISVRLAEKFGYSLIGAYDAYGVKVNS